jgi:hypothetical protein
MRALCGPRLDATIEPREDRPVRTLRALAAVLGALGDSAGVGGAREASHRLKISPAGVGAGSGVLFASLTLVIRSMKPCRSAFRTEPTKLVKWWP